MPTNLYHRAVYAPAPMFRSPGVVRLRYSDHAVKAAKDEKYGDLSRHLRHVLDFDAAEIVEVEVSDGAISKRVVRFPIGNGLVLVMVVEASGFVRTVWANEATDNHKSLDRSKYVQPREMRIPAAKPTPALADSLAMA